MNTRSTNPFAHPSRARLLREVHRSEERAERATRGADRGERAEIAETAEVLEVQGHDERAALLEHLARCEGCRRRLTLLRGLGAALRELPRPTWLTRGLRSGPELRARILERLRRETRRRLASWLRDFVAHSFVLLGHPPHALPTASGAADKRRAGPAHPTPGHPHEAPAETARRALVDVLVDIGRLALRARRTLRDHADLPLDALPLRLPTPLTAEAAIRGALALHAELDLGDDFVRAASELLRAPPATPQTAPSADRPAETPSHPARATRRARHERRAAAQYPTAAPSLRDSLAPR